MRPVDPWNFKDVIDIEESAEKFIRRMTNKCTYMVYLLIAALNGWLLILCYHYNRRRARTRRHTAVLALRDDEKEMHHGGCTAPWKQ